MTAFTTAEFAGGALRQATTNGTRPEQQAARIGPRPASPPAFAPNHAAAGPLPAPRLSAFGEQLPADVRTRVAAVASPLAASTARVHIDDDAAAFARGSNARAVTVGRDIRFGAGEYRPNTADGLALIAHEVTHVDQWLRGNLVAPARKALTTADESALEKAADAAGEQVVEPAQKTNETSSTASNPGLGSTPAQAPSGIPVSGATANSPAADSAALASDESTSLDAANLETGQVAPASPVAAQAVAEADLPIMPPPPLTLSAVEEGRITGVATRARSASRATSTAKKGEANVADSQAAVTIPKSQQDALAAQKLIEELEQEQRPNPEILALCERIKTLIREKRPTSEQAVIDNRPKQVADAAGASVEKKVADKTGLTEKSFDKLAVKPEGSAAPAPTPLSSEATKVAAPDPAATKAVPDAVPDAAISLDADREQMKRKSEDAGIASEPAALVTTGPIANARAAQGELENVASTRPAEVVKQQRAALDKSHQTMAELQRSALEGLAAARESHVEAVSGRQKKFVGGEEEQRKEIAKKGEKLRSETETSVRETLSKVKSDAMDLWTGGFPPISNHFDDSLAAVKRAVDDRHSGVGGWFVSGWDYATGLPEKLQRAYEDAERRFGDEVCDLLIRISAFVEGIIRTVHKTLAEARVAFAKLYSENLPEGLRDWATKQLAGFNKQLDTLGAEAEEARTSFTSELIETAGGAVQSAREQMEELRNDAKGIWGRFLDAVNEFLEDPVRFIINGILKILGISPPSFWALVERIKQVAADIAKKPLVFANNLLKGLAAGFALFFKNIARHLFEGLIKWLLSGLKGESIEVAIPTEFTMKSVVLFFLELLGITWARIRKHLAAEIGEKKVARLEKAAGIVRTLVDKGISGIFEDIKKMMDPKTIIDAIIDAAVSYITESFVVTIAEKLILMLNPAGAIATAIQAIYKVLKWVFTNAAKLFQFVEAVVGAMADVLVGNFGGVAKAIEKALGILVAPIIDFLASFFGFGALPGKVAKALKRLQTWIDSIMKRVVKWVVGLAKRGLAALGIKGDDKKKDAAAAGTDDEIGERLAFESEGETHHLYIGVKGKDATVMVASTPTSAAKWVGHLTSKLANLPEKDRASASALIDRANALISKTDAHADQAAALQHTQSAAQPGSTSQQQAANKESTAEAAVTADEIALREILIALGAVFNEALPVEKLVASDPFTMRIIGTTLGNFAFEERSPKVLVKSENPIPVKTIVSKGGTYNPRTASLTLPSIPTSGLEGKTVSEAGAELSTRSLVPTVSWKPSALGGSIQLGDAPSVAIGSIVGLAVDRPKVGPYNMTVTDASNYDKHHVPPKALANWLSQQTEQIPESVRNLPAAAPYRAAGKSALAEYDKGGPKLTSILIHDYTHIGKEGIGASPEYRVHHGSSTAHEVALIMQKEPKTVMILKNLGVKTGDDKALEDELILLGGKDPSKAGQASTQFYLTELNEAKRYAEGVFAKQVADELEAHFDLVALVFYSAWRQSRAALSVSLRKSGPRDGTGAAKDEALAAVDAQAPLTWRGIDSGLSKMARF